MFYDITGGKIGFKRTLKSSWNIVGLAVVAGGQTVVADAQSGVLHVIDPMTWGAKRELNDYRLTTPTCIARGGPRINDVYVADGARAVVIVFDAINGSVIREFGADDNPGRLAKPIAIAVDNVGRVLVLDKEHRQLFVFDGGNGDFVGTISMTGCLDPRDIAVKNRSPDTNDQVGGGQLFIVDAGRGEIMTAWYEFSPSTGTAQKSSGTKRSNDDGDGSDAAAKK